MAATCAEHTNFFLAIISFLCYGAITEKTAALKHAEEESRTTAPSGSAGNCIGPALRWANDEKVTTE